VSFPDDFNQMKAGFDLGQAVAEADRCLLCHDAPCSRDCPAGTDPGTFIRKLRLKNITGAIRTIKENNILGGACGVLCPVERLCEKACIAMFRSDHQPEGQDRAVRIGDLQRFLVEHGWQTGYKVFDRPTLRKERVAVIGSGPAGLSCAAELAKAGIQVTIFEARPLPGGVLRYGVASFRFNQQFLDRELQDLDELGISFQCNHKIEGRSGAEDLLEQGFNAVFLAPGLWKATPLKTTEHRPGGLYAAVDYLEALKDERLNLMRERFAGQTVAVLGGGAVAMDCAETALRLDAKDVYLIYRRSYLQMPAERHERESALKAGVHFLLFCQPVDYRIDNDRLTGLNIRRTQLGEPDESNRRRPVEIEGSEWTLPVDCVIEAIGYQPETGSPDWYPRVAVSGDGLIKVAFETGATSLPGIFAGGDIVRGPSLVVNAVRDGKAAAAAIKSYLNIKEAQ
jgi:glutamate synthase (NADPH) small chain